MTASATPVNTAGRSECINTLCSCRIYNNKFMQFSGPKFFNIVINEAPLKHKTNLAS